MLTLTGSVAHLIIPSGSKKFNHTSSAVTSFVYGADGIELHEPVLAGIASWHIAGLFIRFGRMWG